MANSPAHGNGEVRSEMAVGGGGGTAPVKTGDLANSGFQARRFDDLRRQGSEYEVSADHHAAPTGGRAQRADRSHR